MIPRNVTRHCIASLLTAAGVILSLCGCEQYHPMPVDESAVNRALAPPDDHDLHARAADLKHLILKPVELDPEQGLSPDVAAVLAVLINPSLRAQRDRHNLGQAALLQAGILPNPQLTVSYAWNTGGTALGNINPYGIGVAYDVNALISHAAKVHSAEWAARSVDLDIAWQEWQTAEAAKTAVYDLISLESQRKIASEVDDRLAENLKLVRQATDLRLKTALDLAAAESAERDAHAVLLQADRDVSRQRLLLNRALGLPPETNVKLRENQSLPAQFTPPSNDELLADLEKHRLDLAALKLGYQSQEQTLVAAVLDQFPKFNLGFSRNVDNTKVRSLELGVGIDIPIFDRNQGAIAAEKATRQKLFDEYISRVFEARADIAQAVDDIHTLNLQIADIQSALPSLQQLVNVYKEASGRGNADVLSYYAAWNNLSQKNLDLLKLEQQLADNRVALEIAAGRYFPNEIGKSASTVPTTLPGVKP